MRPVLIIAVAALATPWLAFAQDHAEGSTTVKTQTANTAPQTVVETPKTRKAKAEQRVTDGTNTHRGSGDPRRRDEYGTPRPEPINGQGTNSSSDAMRAADKAH